MLNHLKGINFNKAVYTKTYTGGEKLYLWSIEGKIGDYFSTTKDAKRLGLPTMPDGTPAYFDEATKTYKPRTLIEVTLPENTSVKTLTSTASDIPAFDGGAGVYTGGDTQVFTTQIKTMENVQVVQ